MAESFHGRKADKWYYQVPSWLSAGVVAAIMGIGGYKVIIEQMSSRVCALEASDKTHSDKLSQQEECNRWIKESLTRIERKIDRGDR